MSSGFQLPCQRWAPHILPSVFLRTMAIFSALTWLALSSAVFAAPSLEPRQTISTLSPSQIAAFAPFTHYAAATGCVPASTLAWDCGAHCQANPTFEPVASGGDGSLVQFCELALVSALWLRTLTLVSLIRVRRL